MREWSAAEGSSSAYDITDAYPTTTQYQRTRLQGLPFRPVADRGRQRFASVLGRGLPDVARPAEHLEIGRVPLRGARGYGPNVIAFEPARAAATPAPPAVAAEDDQPESPPAAPVAGRWMVPHRQSPR